MTAAARHHAVVFDLDGVLINSLEPMRIAFERAYAEVVGPGPAPFEEYRRHLGRHMPDTLRIMGLPTTMYEPFVRESRALVSLVSVYPGIPELLAELAARGTLLAVATGKTTDRAEHVLESVGLREQLHEVIGSDKVAHGKPAPDIVLLALHQLGAAPGQAVMVGDSPLDLRSGRSAGTAVVAACWGEGSPGELIAESPDAAAATVAELRDYLLEPGRADG